MSNFKTWNIRKRHEWLATPTKKKRVKRRTLRRCGHAEAEANKASEPAVEETKG
ncbi:MAG: hypothetical protein FJ096_20430 [Deltaproteobacteria bacterium]|nr:hypothetical protein [Deltaproteobacteria bacterium]